MRIKSPAFEDGKPIPSVYSCQGKNINPPLEFHDVPDDTQSLALIMEDPDSPNGTFTHWMIWNIPPQITKFEEGTLPQECEEGQNSAGQKGYMGPCPGVGNHRYFFKLYAINKRLSVYPGITKEGLKEEINISLIEKSETMGTYQKHI